MIAFKHVCKTLLVRKPYFLMFIHLGNPSGLAFFKISVCFTSCIAAPSIAGFQLTWNCIFLSVQLCKSLSSVLLQDKYIRNKGEMHFYSVFRSWPLSCNSMHHYSSICPCRWSHFPTQPIKSCIKKWCHCSIKGTADGRKEPDCSLLHKSPGL